ncbi:MAG: ribonuclease HII [Nocardioides sp.]|uniref:ribonuclease HII n=1 Tax=Nocardioides sp. TaxID=35761 RepID=UPI003F000966
MAGTRPSLRHERALLRERGAVHLACIDEVGRGALAGPVTLGVVVVTEKTRTAPTGVRDSKLLTPAAREALAPRIRRWAVAHAVGSASPAEIDEFGIMAALRLAGRRALAGLDVVPDLVLLDGNHDYLTPPDQPGLFGEVPTVGEDVGAPWSLDVVTMVKGDMKCAAVAAASVLAKTTRDAYMVGLAADFPEYGWDDNKGYSAAHHVEALARCGPSEHHRRSWNLPGVGDLVPGLGQKARLEQSPERTEVP